MDPAMVFRRDEFEMLRVEADLVLAAMVHNDSVRNFSDVDPEGDAMYERAVGGVHLAVAIPEQRPSPLPAPSLRHSTPLL
jgi:hypothetical protein